MSESAGEPYVDIDVPIERTPDQIRGLYNLITLRGMDDCTDPEGIWAAEGKEHQCHVHKPQRSDAFAEN
jgi:hypothetical protein